MSARKASRMKLEKEVKEPQKPVVRPIYNGMVFLNFRCVDESFVSSAGWSSSFGVGGLRFVGRPKRLRSSTRKPIKKEPPKLAQSTRDVTGASGYCVIASTPRRARVPSREKKVSQDRM